MPAAPRPQGLRVGRVWGIPIYVTWSALFTVVLFATYPVARLQGDGAAHGRALVVGVLFAVLIYLSILMHEIAHAWTARRVGLPVFSVTLGMLGGVTATRRADRPGPDFAVAAAGPAATIVVAVLAAVGAHLFAGGEPGLLLTELALSNALVAVYNLLPGLPLDGGTMLAAVVWAVTGSDARGRLVAGWVGRVVALATMAAPFLLAARAHTSPNVVLVAVFVLIGITLWGGSSAAVAQGRMGDVSAARLAHPARAVAYGAVLASVGGGLAGAERLVVCGPDGRVLGLVSSAALAAVPAPRWADVRVETVARQLDPGLVVSADAGPHDLAAVLGAHPATEYLVTGPDAAVVGVLDAAEVATRLGLRRPAAAAGAGGLPR